MAVYKCGAQKRLGEDGEPECDYEAPTKWRGRCPRCGRAFKVVKVGADGKREKTRATFATMQAAKIKPRIKTNIPEFDKVLNGGIPEGSTVVISGDAGVGKTSLLMITADAIMSKGGKKVVYYAGEQNENDLAEYAQRFKVKSDVVVHATQQSINIYEALDEVERDNADVLILDSLQTSLCPDSKGDVGSTEQGRAVILVLTEWAKKKNVAVFLVSHVNKEGELAGAKANEHLVDGTLEFDRAPELSDDGAPLERTKNWRRLTSGAKFRLGESFVSTVFDMTEEGIKPVRTKSSLLSLVRDEDDD